MILRGSPRAFSISLSTFSLVLEPSYGYEPRFSHAAGGIRVHPARSELPGADLCFSWDRSTPLSFFAEQNHGVDGKRSSRRNPRGH